MKRSLTPSSMSLGDLVIARNALRTDIRRDGSRANIDDRADMRAAERELEMRRDDFAACEVREVTPAAAELLRMRKTWISVVEYGGVFEIETLPGEIGREGDVRYTVKP